jgi:hypothetical protein
MKSHAHKIATLRMSFDQECLVSLHSGPPGATELNEVSYPNYAPVAALFAIGDEMDPPEAVNIERIIFAECEHATVTVTHVGIRKSGDIAVRYYEALPTPVTIGHLIRPEIPAGAIKVIET